MLAPEDAILRMQLTPQNAPRLLGMQLEPVFRRDLLLSLPILLSSTTSFVKQRQLSAANLLTSDPNVSQSQAQ